MNVYREKIIYNFRNQTYWDLCAAIALYKKEILQKLYKDIKKLLIFL